MIEKLTSYIRYIKTPEGFFIFLGLLVAIIPIFLANKNNTRGGRGGNAKVNDINSTAIGGRGGSGGPRGKGGDGGNAEAIGPNSFAMGGEGGEAGQVDRGGMGGRGPLHVLMEDHPEKFKEISKTFGITEEMAKTIGRGGNGGNPTIK